MNTSSFENLARQSKDILDLTANYELEKAESNTRELYHDGISFFQAEVAEWEKVQQKKDPQESAALEKKQREDAPLPVVLNLIDALANEQLQLRQGLKAPLSETTKFFMQCVFLKIIAQAKISEETEDKITNICNTLLHNLPQDEVRTQFALECCKETARALKFQQTSILANLHLNEAAKVLETTWDLNPFKIINRLRLYVEGIYKEFPSVWVFYANAMSLAGVTVTQLDSDGLRLISKIIELYQEHIKKTITFKSKGMIKRCLIEVLTQIVKNCFKEQSSELENLIYQEDKSKICLNYFANRCKLDTHFFPFSSKIRLTAYQALQELILDENLNQHKKDIVGLCTKVLAVRMVLEKRATLASYLQTIFKSLPEENRKLWKLTKREYNKFLAENNEEGGKIRKLYEGALGHLNDLLTRGKPKDDAHSTGGYVPLTEEEVEKYTKQKEGCEKVLEQFSKDLEVQESNLRLMESLIEDDGV